MDLELDEVGAETVAGEPCGHYSLFGVAHARSVGQKSDMLAVDVLEHVVLFLVVHVDALHGHGDHFRTRRQYGVKHKPVGGEFARADKEAGMEFPSSYCQNVFHCKCIVVQS